MTGGAFSSFGRPFFPNRRRPEKLAKPDWFREGQSGAPLSSAERGRKFRERQRNGREVWRIEVDAFALAEVLIELGLVNPDSDDRAEYEVAAGVLLRSISTGGLTRYAVWLTEHGRTDNEQGHRRE